MTRDAPLVVRAEMRALPEVLDHVDARALEAGLDRGARFDIRLAVEEIVTNIIRHGYDEGAPGPVEVACASSAGALRVAIEDRARPFDPDSAPPPDLDSDWIRRRVGGLGRYLAKSVVDDLTHVARDGGGNRWTFSKRVPGGTRELEGT